MHAEKVQNVNKMNQRQTKARLRGHQRGNRDATTTPTLSADQEQIVLNAAFLRQALIKKDFGLKPADIRSMQLHDQRFSKEIAHLELPKNATDHNNKFKLISGILYLSSKTGALKLCVSPIIAESVAC